MCRHMGATEDAASRRVTPVRRPGLLSGQAPRPELADPEQGNASHFLPRASRIGMRLGIRGVLASGIDTREVCMNIIRDKGASARAAVRGTASSTAEAHPLGRLRPVAGRATLGVVVWPRSGSPAPRRADPAPAPARSRGL
jgi:hypothetical protein